MGDTEEFSGASHAVGGELVIVEPVAGVGAVGGSHLGSMLGTLV
ncbi:hypothetical protein [Nocardia sp. NBC_01327]|nr:hypothetical protein OG326_38940 [Nocardia sp. NBC_01327]